MRQAVNSPCEGCRDRWVDLENMTRCHSTCEKYAGYVARRKEYFDSLTYAREYDYMMLEKYNKMNKNQRGIGFNPGNGRSKS